MAEPGGRGGPGPTLVLIFFLRLIYIPAPPFLNTDQTLVQQAGTSLIVLASRVRVGVPTLFPPPFFFISFFFSRWGAIFFLFIFPPKHAYNTHSTQVITHTAHCWGFRTPFTGLVTTQLRGSPAKAAAAPASPLSSVRSKAVAGRPWEAPARPSVNRLLLFGCSSVQYYHRFTGN